MFTWIRKLFPNKNTSNQLESYKEEEIQSVEQYTCFVCGKTEIRKAKEDVLSFYRRWGRAEERLNLLYQGDGTFRIEPFCPRCQKEVLSRCRKYLHGYIESDIYKVANSN